MNLDATLADRELVFNLIELIEGLPHNVQVELFHDLHSQVHKAANSYQVTQGAGYEDALRQATKDHIPNPGNINLELLWVHRHDIFAVALTLLPNTFCSFWRHLARRPEPARHEYIPFGPEDTIGYCSRNPFKQLSEGLLLQSV